jgi:hypothetical protein
VETKRRVEARISDYNSRTAPKCGSSPFDILAQRETVSTLHCDDRTHRKKCKEELAGGMRAGTAAKTIGKPKLRLPKWA